MKGELLATIEFMEKDRGLDRGTLIATIEQAIETSARKIESLPPGVVARIDQTSGEINAYSDVLVVADGEAGPVQEPAAEGEPEKPPIHWWHASKVRKYVAGAQPGTTVRVNLDMDEFGRIAAQAAKQVIIQRIREAERDNILSEYTGKIGEIVHGTVARMDRGNLIVDIGRTEAVLPRKEQSPLEHYRQGDKIRAIVLGVEDIEEGHVPKVMLSRVNTGLIRRLFEFEVPEIYDGIVEIKTVAREAGFRTKVAIVSHDPKIDCVGACVGVRGSRVKNIVQEVAGEKVDIVRWSEHVETFVANALNPVEIVRTYADHEGKQILVVVPDDQLSLAIGRSGQNIRLTSKLTGWKVDVIRQSEADRVAQEHGLASVVPDKEERASSIFKNVQAPKLAKGARTPARARAASIFKVAGEVEVVVNKTPLDQMMGISASAVEKLAEAGITTVADLRAASRETLLAVPGVGEKTVEKILKAVAAAT